jgi:hypothetical protein
MSTENKPIYDGGTIEFSKPSIGYVNLIIGKTIITGISYINPYVVYDVADWLINACQYDRFFEPTRKSHSESIMLDCESLGQAYLTKHDSKDITVTREHNPNSEHLIAYSDDIDGNEARVLNSLADSIERYFNEFIEFECPEESDIPEAREHLTCTIKRLREEAELHEHNNDTPQRMFNRLARIQVSELTQEDLNALKAIFQLKMAFDREYFTREDNTNAHNVVRSSWELDRFNYKFNNDGTLKYAKLTIKASYFEDRQIVFLRDDNCVELAGWADAKNAKTIRQTFATWCKTVKEMHDISPYDNI